MTSSLPPGELIDIRRALSLESAQEGHHWRLALGPRLGVGDRAHGGFLLAALAAAGVAEVAASGDYRDPIAVTAQYHSAAKLAPAMIEAAVRRPGRSVSQVLTTLRQDGATLTDGLVTVGRLPDEAAVPIWIGRAAPELPPIEDCFALPVPGARVRIQIWDHIGVWLDPATAGWARREPGGVAEQRAWVRCGGPPDVLAVLVALDILPSVSLEFGSRGWNPTLQLSAYVRGRPAPGLLRVRQYATWIDQDTLNQTCEVWDSRDRLVAQSTQLTGVRFPRPER
jgi:hypothetical protein